ncbi:hypothetical protein JB92DRAFT_517717 [Gautieria morchelliformis]|nr:hypothetical protein JB92DRAFT_517717 [Gautieria morchelliformis]
MTSRSLIISPLVDGPETKVSGHGELAGVLMNLVGVIAKQVLMGLEYLHDECGLVHTDIRPENICTHPEYPLNHPIMNRTILILVVVYQIHRSIYVPSSRHPQLFLVSVSRSPVIVQNVGISYHEH